MKRQIIRLLLPMALLTTGVAGLAMAQVPKEKLEGLAAGMAAKLAAACPRASASDVDAYTSCSKALRTTANLPLSTTVAWGGDQPTVRVAKKNLTSFGSELFRALYLSLFWFDGTWKITHDDKDDVDVVHIGAYFRNKMTSDEYPYPFWHSTEKWSAYERANELKFYLKPTGEAFAITRGTGGNEAGRGEALIHHVPPTFDGRWMWTDANGEHPKVSLFANKFSADNPYQGPLDKAYRTFALQMRDGTCLRCHSPNNRAEMSRLILLQTPAHAASEIKKVLKAVRDGDMPQDSWGLKKELDSQLRTALLTSGEEFSKLLSEADQWEAQHKKP